LKLAIMQPYFMPYVGYWQLLAAADRLIVLDDVTFIRRGWVNRNRILVNGAVHRFTIPVRQASQHRLIKDLDLAADAGWLASFRATLMQSYRRAAYFEETLAFLEPVLACCHGKMLPFLLFSIDAVTSHLGIHTPRTLASMTDPEHRNGGQERILNLCQHEQASTYLNLPGGRALYDEQSFRHRGLHLQFIIPREQRYPQGGRRWWPWLSIIDLLMHLGQHGTRTELLRCDIEQPTQTQRWQA